MEDVVQMSVRVPRSIRRALRIMATKRDKTLQEFVTEVLLDFAAEQHEPINVASIVASELQIDSEAQRTSIASVTTASAK